MSTGKIIGIVILVLGLTIGIFSGKLFFYEISNFVEYNDKYGSGSYEISLFNLFPFVLGVVLFFTGSYIKNNAKTDDTSNKSLNNKKCPFCANDIKKEAILCQYCNKDLPVNNNENTDPDFPDCEPCIYIKQKKIQFYINKII